MKKAYERPGLELVVCDQDVVLNSTPDNLGLGDWGVQDEL